MSDSIPTPLRFPHDLRYTKEHEWARREGDVVVVGITAHAVEQLGDITLVTLPEPGTIIKAGDAFGDVDSVKAVSELYAPIDGEVVERNRGLDDAPEKVNESPYADGWMIKVKPANASDLDRLLDAAAYEALLDAE
jgi:glycine cleavage system H protein